MIQMEDLQSKGIDWNKNVLKTFTSWLKWELYIL